MKRFGAKFLVVILFALTVFDFNLRCDLQDISRKDESDLSKASSNRGMSLCVKLLCRVMYDHCYETKNMNY